ncbi:unnamed protein product [Phaedon cochleariae]|uniref:General transcription factor II-I repeat domain-containing protein 2A n=1 Tax=Phaedon cochleariae TaxID=80249 RepID=A0A9N9X2D5_PHACE|nr:unnamed protein product [Phaedon cochleariae]
MDGNSRGAIIAKMALAANNPVTHSSSVIEDDIIVLQRMETVMSDNEKENITPNIMAASTVSQDMETGTGELIEGFIPIMRDTAMSDVETQAEDNAGFTSNKTSDDDFSSDDSLIDKNYEPSSEESDHNLSTMEGENMKENSSPELERTDEGDASADNIQAEDIDVDILALPPDVDELTDEEDFDDEELGMPIVKDIPGNVKMNYRNGEGDIDEDSDSQLDCDDEDELPLASLVTEMSPTAIVTPITGPSKRRGGKAEILSDVVIKPAETVAPKPKKSNRRRHNSSPLLKKVLEKSIAALETTSASQPADSQPSTTAASITPAPSTSTAPILPAPYCSSTYYKRSSELQRASSSEKQKTSTSSNATAAVYSVDATDGARSMTGIHRGVTSILQKKINHEILTFHCIIHQEALCAQTFPAEIIEVMNLVIKIINSILAKALYHRQFKDFLEEINSQYSDLLLHNKVRWLSRGNVLQRFALILSEIKTFLNEENIDHFELKDDKWLQKFNFMVDTTMKLNELNLKLQGRGNPAYALLEEVVCFEQKLLLLVEDMESSNSIHFKNLKKYRDETNATIDTNYFSLVIKNIKDGFAERFEQFKSNKSTLAFIVNPLNTNTNEINIEPLGIDAGSLQMQLLDLKTKDLWSGKFTELKSKLEELEVKKCMHIAQHKWTALKEMPHVETLIFDAWNSLP